MSLFVHPDPEEPAGGFAFLELPEASLPDTSVTVAVFDAYGERWLASSEALGERIDIGDANWQSDRVDFGPYEVHRYDGADWVRIGPEIVNKLEEYAPLRLVVAGQSHDVTWPDTVPPRAGAAVLGALRTVSRKPDAPGADRLVGKAAPPPAVEPPDVPVDVPQPEVAPAKSGKERGKGSLLIVLLILVLLAVMAVLVWMFWRDDAITLPAPPPLVENPCSLSSLGAVPGGFAATAQAIRECGADVSAETALRLVEDAAARNDPTALFLFGTLYDGEAIDPRIEKLIGLTFADDPAKAVEYYDRAVKAGSTEAEARRFDTCARLSGSGATLAEGAYDDFCRD